MKVSSSEHLRVGDNEVSMFRNILVLLAVGAVSSLGQQPTPDALFQTAVNQLASKQFAEANSTFRRLREGEPGGVRAAVGVAQTLLAQGLGTDAVAYMTGEVAKDSANAKLNVALGDIALQSGQIDIALTRFGRTLELLSRDPNSARFYVKRSARRSEMMSDPLAAALDNFIGTDTTPPGPAGVFLRLGEAFLRGGDSVHGIGSLEAARRLLPAEPGLLLDLAILYEATHDQPRAIGAYRDLLRLVPDNPAALNNLAYLLAETGGDLDEALRNALRAHDLQPQSDEVSDTLGWVYVKRETNKEAMSIYVKLVQKSPQKDTYRRHLRKVLDQIGDTSPAITELKTALEAPSDEAANLALSTMLAKLYPAP